ncbi:MAG: trans-sialidase [Candidatus Nitrosotenuis sp.]
MSGTTKSTKKDLEAQIAEFEGKLAKLASQFESKPQVTTPPPAPKPQVQTPPPAPKPAPAPTTKPQGTLPAGFKPAPAPAPAPKPQVQTPPPAPKPEGEVVPAWEQWRSAPTSDFHSYRAKVTGYSPAGNRYFASKHVVQASVPTSDWNLQKAKVTGYTQPSNKYFATREKLAYHPRTKYFAGYGIQSTATGSAQTQTAPPPAPKPNPTRGSLPAGTKQVESSGSSGNENASRKEQLEAYEKEYLARMQQQTKTAPPPKPNDSNRGSLPAGFKPTTPPPAPAKSKGTLPKGF